MNRLKYLILLFIIVPAMEIGLFIMAGKAIGVITTVSLIILTGLLGAYLAKRQGLEALRKVQAQLRSGQPPGNAMLDGVCILAGGILLLAPGFISDLTGLLLLLPITRNALRPLMLKVIRNWISRKQVYIYR
ncbi:FxsA family protein [Lederbergia citrea]|uniref:FxsA family protein n=1 Tax=Lederbergia citrea TaxID=2833581 RepID=UPI003211BD24